MSFGSDKPYFNFMQLKSQRIISNISLDFYFNTQEFKKTVLWSTQGRICTHGVEQYFTHILKVKVICILQNNTTRAT